MLNHFANMIVLTVKDPAAAARWVLDGGLPSSQTWLVFLLASALSGFFAQIGLILQPLPSTPEMMAPNGITMAFMVAGSILILTGAITWIGRAFGGTGTAGEVMRLVTWMQFVMIALQIIQIFAGIISQDLSVLLAWFGIGVMLWMMTHFVTVVHGFGSPGMVFFGIIGSALGLAVVMSVLIVTVGLVAPQGG